MQRQAARRNSNLLSHTWPYFQLFWDEQVLNLTGKDNFKSEPGEKDVGRYLSAGKKKNTHHKKRAKKLPLVLKTES